MKKVWSYLFLFCFCFCFQAMGFAEGETAPSLPKDQGFTQTLIMIAIALVFFYLILWRPEQKRRKVLEEQRSGLKKGDRVIAMGIIGTVSKIDEHSVTLTMVDGNKIEFVKAAITEVLPNAAEEAAKSKAEGAKSKDEG